MNVFSQYIWADEYRSTSGLRSKLRLVDIYFESFNILDFLDSVFVGAPLQQFSGHVFDSILKQVNFISDSIFECLYSVSSELHIRDRFNYDTNTRAILKQFLENQMFTNKGRYNFGVALLKVES